MSERLVRLIVISDFVSQSACQHTRVMYPRLPFRVSPFPRPAHGVLSPIASFRTPSRNARTFQYRLRSNTGHSSSTIPLPPSPLIRMSTLGGKLVENDGKLARLWLRNAAKPWASICESSNSYLILFHPFLFEWPSPCVVQGACTCRPECADSLATGAPHCPHDLSVRPAGAPLFFNLKLQDMSS